MKQSIIITISLLCVLNLHAQFENLSFGTDSTLDVITWNIEHFPKNGQTTINLVAQIVDALNADVIAIQEVSDEVWLTQLIENLDGWDGYYAYDQYVGLAYIYRTAVVEDVNIFEIYTSKSRELPRAPLVLEMNYAGESYAIINNHFKCCGDGYLNIEDPWDEETRRYDACVLIDEYISANYPDAKVMLLGDLNDVITDNPANNVFEVFIESPQKYLFVDMPIAQGSSSGWSYPTWPSHIDHIMINDVLFNEYENNGSAVETIKLDNYFDGWYAYDADVSDHRPVGIKIKTDASLGIDDNFRVHAAITNYPNPFNGSTTISVAGVSQSSQIVIYNTKQQIIDCFKLESNQTSIIWTPKNIESGIYYVQLIEQGIIKSVGKMVVIM